jgi:hypothetical protein
MPHNVRKLALTIHLTSSVGWIGAVLAYLALGVAAVTSSDTQTVRAAWTAMDVTGWWVIVPLALAALVTGLVMSLGTRWGLFRHYWTLISLALTVVCTVVLVLHMPTVSSMARLAQELDGADLRALGGDLFHPSVGLLLLLTIAVLNVYKPAGVTPYGWRKQRDEARSARARPDRPLSTLAAASTSAGDAPRFSRVRRVATGTGYFAFHFAEMLLAMFMGMALFMMLRIFMSRGFAAFEDTTSAAFVIGMAVFMLAPMLVWMRLRGCNWQQCAEMSAAMMVAPVATLALQALALESMSAWVATNQHALMLVGMLAVMLYRRGDYTRGYTFLGGTHASSGRPIGVRQVTEV